MNHSSEDLLLITFVKNSKGQQKFEWKIVGLVAEISMGGAPEIAANGCLIWVLTITETILLLLKIDFLI